MALFKLSALVSDIKGKLGGSIFQRNPGGLSLRARTNTKARSTSPAQPSKQNMARLGDWSNLLTQAERDGWTAQGPNYMRPDKYGNPRQPSGFQLFARLNLIRFSAGLPMLLAAPTPSPANPPGTFSFAAAVPGNYTLTWTTPLLTTGAVFVYAHRSIPRGRKRPNSAYKLVGVAQTLLQTSINIHNAYVSFFGSANPASRFHIKVVPVRKDKGIAGVPIYLYVDFPAA